ncbi:MAG: sugar phosphate isomerase/epimerase [Pseudomonadota bacterium]
MNASRELIASYFTLAGHAVPFEEAQKEVSPHTLADRANAAAAAGFAGLGISYPDLASLLATMSFGDIRRIFDEHGLTHLELECIVDWHADGERLDASNTVRALLMGCAAEIGACHIKVAGDQFGGAFRHEQVVERFAGLCADAAVAGTRIVIEPMPWSNVRDILGASQLVAEAGAANAGVLMDIWHVARAGTDFSAIADMAPETIGYIELCDALLESEDDLKLDTINNRRLCGEGQLDVAAFVAAVERAGYSGLWGVEVISHEQRRRPVRIAASLCADSAKAFL